MVGLKGALHPGLLDEKFWGERLREEAAVPLKMLVLPSGNSSEGLEAFELLVGGRDGERLHAVLVRRVPHGDLPAIGARRALRLVPGHAEHHPIDLADCEAELCFEPAPHKRLEERVLDTLRMLRAARRVEGVAGARALAAGNSELPPPDEFLIAECLLNRGWI
jgi:hypothetical protein